MPLTEAEITISQGALVKGAVAAFALELASRRFSSGDGLIDGTLHQETWLFVGGLGVSGLAGVSSGALWFMLSVPLEFKDLADF